MSILSGLAILEPVPAQKCNLKVNQACLFLQCDIHSRNLGLQETSTRLNTRVGKKRHCT